jgi:hypothetical protein
MRHTFGARVLILAGSLLAIATLAAPCAIAGVTATNRPEQIRTALGNHFTVRTTVTNPGGTASGKTLAHLNVVSLHTSVYVDPEDWSPSRTRMLASLAPGTSSTVTWQLQAVNAGSFDVYVVLIPAESVAANGSSPRLVVSPATHVDVTARRTLDPGGSLRVALAVPALIGAGALALRWRRRDRAAA